MKFVVALLLMSSVARAELPGPDTREVQRARAMRDAGAALTVLAAASWGIALGVGWSAATHWVLDQAFGACITATAGLGLLAIGAPLLVVGERRLGRLRPAPGGLGVSF